MKFFTLSIVTAATAMTVRRMVDTKIQILMFAALALEHTSANSEESIVYRCPGPPVLYSDALTAEEARANGCRAIDDTTGAVIIDVEQKLLSMSKQFNANTPLKIDNEKTLEVTAAIGKTIIFKYKFIDESIIKKKNFSSKLYEKHLLRSLQTSTCPDPGIQRLMQQGAKFNYLFTDKAGNSIVEFTLDAKQCAAGNK